MARRRGGTRTRYRTRVKKVYRRGKGMLGGSMKPLIDGALGEVAADVLGGFAGEIGQAGGYALVGMFRRNQTLTTLAGMQLGNLISKNLPFGSSQGGGGVYES